MKTLIKNIQIVNEGRTFFGGVLIDNDLIINVFEGDTDAQNVAADKVIDGSGKMLLPGVIDDQVHFREPGLTHKADIASESAAAVVGGVTSFMEMPNTMPQTTTYEALTDKYERAAKTSLANYSFYIGATNDNLQTILETDFTRVCGIKLFMGSSTGNMLVDNEIALDELFKNAPAIITAHCEDESTIRRNIELYKQKYGEDVPWSCHSEIRSAEACYKSSAKAAELARKHGARLHILHLSSAKEIDLLDDGPSAERRVTGEICVHHLWFSDKDYASKAQYIKWNPSIKSEVDRDALRKAINSGRVEVVATDHAPHTLAEKQGSYFKAPSGAPMVQHSLVAMLEMAEQGVFTIEKVVESMCHAPARLFGVEGRGFIRVGYKADLVIIEKKTWTVDKTNIRYKCGWSPLEGTTFRNNVFATFVGGQAVYFDGKLNADVRGERLTFKR